jgi:hypothetical protein
VRVCGRHVVLICLLMAAGCGTWFDKKDFQPTSPSVVDALQLSVDKPAIPADGFATTLVTATISADAALTHRIVVFVTTTGTFVGSTASDRRTIERTVESSTAKATVQLQSSRTVESARVSATVKDVAGLGREILVEFTAPSPSDIIRLAAPASALADGATITPITAEISGSLPAGRRTVTFATTFGGFVGDPAVRDGSAQSSVGVDADGGNRATAYLRSPSSGVGVAFVTARVDTSPAVSASTSVQFTRAAPERVLVTLDKAALQQNNSSILTVTVTLVREPGVPTEGTIVTFRAVDASGAERGLFTKVQRSDPRGVATADFSPGELAALGQLTITATAEGLSGTARVQIVPVP